MNERSSTTRAASAPTAEATLGRADYRVRERGFGAPPARSVRLPARRRRRDRGLSRPVDRSAAVRRRDRAGARAGRDCGRVCRPRRGVAAIARIGAAARQDDRVGVHRRRALLSRLVGSRPSPPRGLRALRQPRDFGASLPGQVCEPRARFRRRHPRPADKADGGGHRNRRARRVGERFRSAVRQAQYARGQDRDLRRQLVPRPVASRRSGAAHLGALS